MIEAIGAQVLVEMNHEVLLHGPKNQALEMTRGLAEGNHQQEKKNLSVKNQMTMNGRLFDVEKYSTRNFFFTQTSLIFHF